MLLELLELLVRAQVRVGVVQADHHAYMDQVRLHVIDEGPSVGHLVQGPADRVHHRARDVDVLGHLPDLLDAQAVVLRGAILAEVEVLHERLAQGAAAALRKDGLLAQELHARLEDVLLRTVLGDAHVGQLHADQLAPLAEDRLVGGKARVDLDLQRLGLLRKPAAQHPEGDDVVAVLGQRREELEQRAGHRHGVLPVGEPVEGVAGHRSVQRSALLLPVREELVEGPGLEDVPGEDVSSDLGALLHDADAQLLALLDGHLLGADGSREPSGPAADDDDVELHLVPLLSLRGEPPDAGGLGQRPRELPGTLRLRLRAKRRGQVADRPP
mmetsp:Transcript_32727/g.83412  ORF Transcript_32727/g.83412 Transcript_32727/m.83412 type:complete len:328 (-) Transcript_32727:160-1143(-)